MLQIDTKRHVLRVCFWVDLLCFDIDYQFVM